MFLNPSSTSLVLNRYKGVIQAILIQHRTGFIEPVKMHYWNTFARTKPRLMCINVRKTVTQRAHTFRNKANFPAQQIQRTWYGFLLCIIQIFILSDNNPHMLFFVQTCLISISLVFKRNSSDLTVRSGFRRPLLFFKSRKIFYETRDGLVVVDGCVDIICSLWGESSELWVQLCGYLKIFGQN